MMMLKKSWMPRFKLNWLWKVQLSMNERSAGWFLSGVMDVCRWTCLFDMFVMFCHASKGLVWFLIVIFSRLLYPKRVTVCFLVWFQDLGSSAGSKRPTCVILIKPHEDYQDAYNECMEEVSCLPKPLWDTSQSMSSSEVINQLFKGALRHFGRSFSSSK